MNACSQRHALPQLQLSLAVMRDPDCSQSLPCLSGDVKACLASARQLSGSCTQGREQVQGTSAAAALRLDAQRPGHEPIDQTRGLDLHHGAVRACAVSATCLEGLQG